MINGKELLKLIQENPDLPIVPIVCGEVVQDDCKHWLGSVSNVEVNEWVYVDEQFYTRDDQYDIEGHFIDKYCAEAECAYNPQISEIAREKAEALPWKKAIIVYIRLPEL